MSLSSLSHQHDMITLRLLLLSALWLLSSITIATPDTPKPGDVLPAFDALRANLQQSKTGLDLTLENAYYYAGWIPRGFITGVLRIRPSLLPGAPLTKQQWLDGSDYREGLYFLPGLTEWGARYRAARYDQRKRLEAANQDYSGTAEIGFGRFLGSAFDPAVLILVALVFTWLRHYLRERRLHRRALTEMAGNQRGAAPHPLDTGPPPTPVFRPTHPPESTSGSTLDLKSDRTIATQREAFPSSEPHRASAPPHPQVADPPKPPVPKPTSTPNTTTGPVEETPVAAFQACQLEAERGSIDDQYRLAVMYRDGTGVNTDAVQASRWFREAAVAGHSRAQLELARRLLHGTGLLADKHAAALWLEQAAHQGLANAKFNLATLYARGLGVARNPSTALDWLQQAANERDADAEELLGTAYEHGWLGLKPDPAKAGFWHQRALAGQTITRTT